MQTAFELDISHLVEYVCKVGTVLVLTYLSLKKPVSVIAGDIMAIRVQLNTISTVGIPSARIARDTGPRGGCY